MMIISASYTTALSVASTSNWVLSPLNPAIALAEITMSLNKVSEMNWVWIFLTFGWLGSILAVVLFEFVFRNAAAIVDGENSTRDEEKELLGGEFNSVSE
jgi:hypothetical protein